jgi:hypothetical protein
MAKKGTAVVIALCWPSKYPVVSAGFCPYERDINANVRVAKRGMNFIRVLVLLEFQR